MKKQYVLHFGAGKIGKALIGYIYTLNNYELIFIDNNKERVTKLAQAKKYLINIENQKHIVIENFSIYQDISEVKEKLQDVEFLSCSIGTKNLKSLIAPLHYFVSQNENAAIIAFENGKNVSSLLKRLYLKKYGHLKNQFLNCLIDRIVPEQNSETEVYSEAFYEIVLEAKNNSDKRLEGITYTHNLEKYQLRKLFLVNVSHGFIAYHFINEYQFVNEALAKRQNLEKVQAFMEKMAHFFIIKNYFTKKELKLYIEQTLKRFLNPKLRDSLSRIGHHPITKISPEGRYYLLLKAFLENGFELKELFALFRAIFRFKTEDRQSQELNAFYLKNGFYQTLITYTKLNLETNKELKNWLQGKDHEKTY